MAPVLRRKAGKEYYNISKYDLKRLSQDQHNVAENFSKDKVGYEINFTKYFYEFVPLRSLKEIKTDILKLLDETEGAVREIIE